MKINKTWVLPEGPKAWLLKGQNNTLHIKFNTSLQKQQWKKTRSHEGQYPF